MKNPILCSLAAALLAGCNAQSGATIAQIGPGSECANGGVAVTSGGKTEIICNGTSGNNGADGGNGAPGGNGVDGGNGASGSNTLILTTALAAGSTQCPNGGEEVQSGPDNGAGGGTANDGIVVSTSYVCNGGAGGAHVGSASPPSGASAGYTIKSLGGVGVDGGAGSGGLIKAQIVNGTEGGNVAVFATGVADPSFTFPALPAFDPGAQPASITKSVTLGGYTGSLAKGDLFLDGQGVLYVLSDAVDGGSVAATSLTIANAVVVDVTPANGAGTTGAPCYLQVNGPIVSSGELSTVPGQGGELLIGASNYFGDATSSIINNGVDGTSTPSRTTGAVVGSSGGANSGGIHLSAGTFWNRGVVQANGGAGATGGNAGSIYLQTLGNGGVPIFNAGAVSAHGGIGTQGVGGRGARIEIDGTGDVNNAGALDTHGGDGTQGGGGAGQIYLQAAQSNLGSLRNSGAINASGGGGCTGSQPGTGTCTGGGGSSITLFGQNGILTTNAPISATGGSVAAGVGGNGGSVNIYTSNNGQAYSSGSNYLVPSGDLVVSGSIDASGGAGWSGGQGGNVLIGLDPQSQPNGQQVLLYGYSALDASGSNGTHGGGSGGQIILSNSQYFPPFGTSRALEGPIGQLRPGGSVLDYVNLSARGGSGGDLAGGPGGNLQLVINASSFFPGDDFENVVTATTLDCSSGDGANGGGDGSAGITINAVTGASLSGQLLARGGAGDGSGNNGLGGSGGVLHASTIHGTLTDAAIGDFSGGNGARRPGSGTAATLNADRVIFSGQLSLNGGAGTAANTPGANGGEVDITSNGGVPSQITAPAPGSISVKPGAPGNGGEASVEGAVFIDGFNVTSSWSH
jgi:hypothetical protein